MKTIGIIGGMSWQSTAQYYRQINETVAKNKNELSSAKMIINSVDFRQYAQWQHDNDWSSIADSLYHEAKRLEAAGADGIALATNTMHKVADAIMADIDLPFLHIGRALALHLERFKLRKVAVLGTRFTMSDSFLGSAINEHYTCDIVAPSASKQESIHRIIYHELCHGMMLAESKQIIGDIMGAINGVQGYILACTELPLLVSQDDTELPILDSTAIHADYLANWSLT